jgi:hypothetical protein
MYSLWKLKAYKNTCFKLHGYLEWWKELKKKRRQESGKARVAMAVS